MDTTPTTTATATFPTKTPKKKLTRIEKEIKKYQTKVTGTLIPRSCMKRVIDEHLADYAGNFRITRDAVNMLQLEAEARVVERLTKANKLAELAKRDTVTANDLKLVAYFEQ